MNLDDLKDRVRIGDLFRTTDRKSQCPVPSHQDKTASVSLNHAENWWHCFGCGAGGSVVDYFVHVEGLSTADAIKRLAEWAGVELAPLTPEVQERISRTERRERALRFATDYFRRQLGGEAEQYLLRRGFTPETIEGLQIGYDDKRLAWMIQTNGAGGIPESDFEACGLIRKGDRGRYRDFLGSRLIFPVIVGGRVRTLTARDLTGTADAKYMHLPESVTVDGDRVKLELGAGLDWLYLEDNLRRSERVFVCEGPPDTITLHQWGVPVVGLLGVQGIKPHAHKFKGKVVYLAFDGDDAGRNSTIKSAQILEDAGAKAVYIVRPPDGANDWNDWALAGATAEQFNALADKANAYLAEMILAVDKDAQPEERGAQLQPIWRILASRPAEHLDSYIDLIKQHLGIGKGNARKAIDQSRKDQEAQAKSRADHDAASSDELIYEDRRHLVPALDFTFNSPATAMTTVYIPTKRKAVVKDEVVEDVFDDPYLIRVTLDGGQRTVEQQPLRVMDLSKREKNRIPDEDTIRGRWRLSGRHPYSVAAFATGKAPDVDVPKLFDDIRALFKAYVHLPDDRDFDLLTVWTMQSYVYRLFNAVGYLWLNGPRGTAKSTIAEFLAQLGFNADRAGSVTEAVLFRTIEANCSTLMIDEAEKLSSPDPKSQWFNLALLCNDGYKRGATAKRMEPKPDGGWATVSFDVYSPKAFASIKDINYVLASRCIRIASEMATADERKNLKDVAQNIHRLDPIIADLRDRLYCWMLTCFAEVQHAYTDVLLDPPELNHLRNREREMWLPLLAIATHIDNRRFPDGGAVPALDQLITGRLVELQKEKQALAQSRETEARLELSVLAIVHEVVTSEELAPVRADFGDGALFIIREIAEICTDRAREAGHIGPDAKITSRMVTGFLNQLGAIDAAENERTKVDGKTAVTCRIRESRLLAAMQRYGVAKTD